MSLETADQEWRGLIEPLLPIGEQAAEMWPETHENAELRHDLWWFMYSQIAAGFMTLAQNEAQPDWFPCWGQLVNNIGNINPDGTYYMTPIDDQGVYRLQGTRGTLHIVDIQVGDGTVFAQGRLNADNSFGPTFANYDLDYDVTVDANGWFDVIMSRERPEVHEGDWWELPAGSNYALVRQFSYDWVNEIDARIAIERLDTPAQRPRRDPDFIRERLGRIPEYVYAHQRTMDVPVHAEKGLSNPGLDNNLVKIDYAPDQAGRAGQWYIAGRFDIADDEALILEIAPGDDCRYWNLHVGNEMCNTMDFYNRIVNTNGHQAQADADGAFRIVVSAKDPGVWNWMDTMGQVKGFLWGRMDRANEYQPKATKVPLAEVGDHLPEGTRGCTPEERDAEIRRRRMGAQLRRRW